LLDSLLQEKVLLNQLPWISREVKTLK